MVSEKHQNSIGDQTSTLTIVSGATMLALIVFTVPLTTLTPTALELAAGPALQAWILSGMPLGAAAGLLGTGALGDTFSRRLVFLWGLAVIVIASLVAAMAPSGSVLVFARIAQGLGSAAILSCGLGLVGQVFQSAQERIRATAIWAAALGAGVSSGPIIAASLTMAGGWRAAHIGTLVLALFFLLWGIRRLPDATSHPTGLFDWLGAIVFFIAMSSLMTGLTQLRFGWSDPYALMALAFGFLFLLLFVVVEKRRENPVLELALFRSPDFVGATVAAFASGAGVLALMTLVPTLLQRSLGTSALLAAVILLAWSFTSVVSALSARWLLSRFSPASLLVAGLAFCGVAQLMMVNPNLAGTELQFLPALFLAGAANGVMNSALGKQAVASVPNHLSAMGSGANNTARYLGSAIGITVGAVLMAHGEEVDQLHGLLHGWNQAVYITAFFAFLGAVIVLFTQFNSRHVVR